jgi:molybdate transport system regulatory protein
MNRLRGRIIAIESNDQISLVDVAVGVDTFTAILLETPASAPYLAIDHPVLVLFKETEVSLAKNLSGQISLRNRIHGTVKHIRHGDILSEVTLEYRGQAVVSVITSRAVVRLGLREGEEAEALIKANEVSLTGLNDEL